VASVVRPALARGAVVITDRYIDSSVAYQGAGRSLDPAEVASLSEWATEGLRPALTVLLDIDPAVGLLRAGGDADRLESEPMAFHTAVRAHFLALAAAEPQPYLVLDASAPRDRIAEQVLARVRELLR
jgi:dTMP kinase